MYINKKSMVPTRAMTFSFMWSVVGKKPVNQKNLPSHMPMPTIKS